MHATSHHLARLTFWSVDRDRRCGSGGDSESCSGVSPSPCVYTEIFARYAG